VGEIASLSNRPCRDAPRIVRRYQIGRFAARFIQMAGKACRLAGNSALTQSPGLTSPLDVTIPRTPALNVTPRGVRTIIDRLRPFFNLSINPHGVRSPVNSTTDDSPRCNRAPCGNARRSIPTVVMFSPRSPGAMTKPKSLISSNNSDWIRCTWRRFGVSGAFFA
jgi:hypothetical protein